MRVVFVLGTTSGGTGRHVLMLAEGLVRRGHQVVVAAPSAVGETFGFGAAGARFVPVAVSDRPHPARDLAAVAQIRRITREADVVHAHGLRAGALAVLAGLGRSRPRSARTSAVRRAGRPALVVTLHNALTAGGFVGAVYGVLERIVARGADRVLVVSPDLGERMTALGAGDVRPAVVPAPVPRPPSPTAAQVREELGAGERPVVLTVARLAQQKGLEFLLDVAAGPWGAREPMFAIAGEGPLKRELQERIEKEKLPVWLLGNRDDVPDLLAAADVVFWPSRWEGQPLSLSEALMAGRPVVATEVGGIPDLLGGAGTLVPYGDVGAARAAVRALLEEPGAAERQARAAAERGAALPRDDDAVAAVLGVYNV
ncbi:glycosyltransferase [Nonomuraea endophytica]|uniref:Glycosyltransferase involved in cell wall biosynthesis n=1 Tax=Nonomuraea endophytica TaxID=714136 RepID=A0A7W8ADU4_9ACTN|nr:glycosyltransferase [Nonomuraea endophytica]MBB5084270.1 glycosyltransferase involved in cell wall biosynthesis [Nonomuraea endophytica]